jgi:hypothetical protein
MLLRPGLILSAVLLAACSDPSPPPPPRAELRSTGGAFSVVPAPGQLPLCLIMEVRRGAVRPLAATEDGQSLPCSAGAAIGEKTFTPAQKDDYRVFVIFSDRALKADTVAQQISDRLGEGMNVQVTAMDLRAPGQVTLQSLDVRPAEISKSK